MTLKEIFLSIFHIRTFTERVMGILLTIIGSFLGYFHLIFFDNKDLFLNVAVVIIGDWLAGVAVAIKKDKFQTQKALKFIWYLVAYEGLLAEVLSIEKSYPSAFWLSEAVIMPLLVLQTISMVKNLSILKLIPSRVLSDILARIDKHKEE
jgi:hypothetical protein